MINKIMEKVNATNEEDFLKYLIDCCENILENPKMVQAFRFSPIELQLIKLRAEVTQRLENRFDIKYGAFAFNEHLFSHTRNNSGLDPKGEDE